MNQALITALQTTRNERNIILMVPYLTPEDDIISALEEMIAVAQESKDVREKAEQAATTSPDQTAVVETTPVVETVVTADATPADVANGELVQ